MEIWKDVPTYEGEYQVSNYGNVRSIRFNKCRYLKITINTNGYYIASISKDSKSKTYKVHQLVAMAFLGHNPCGMDLVVDHKNDDKLDNRVENLQIVTQRFNAYKTQGKHSSKYKGVSWHKQAHKWMSEIRINKKKYYLGLFVYEYDAHLAYQSKLKEYATL